MGKGLMAVAALLVTLMVAGCGGEDDSTAGGPSVSKEEFIRKADAACKRGNERMEAGFATLLKKQGSVRKPSEAEYEALVEEVLIPSLRREVREIGALSVPSEGENQVEAMVKALEEGLQTAETTSAEVAVTSDAVFGIASRLAEEYGLEVCGGR